METTKKLHVEQTSQNMDYKNHQVEESQSKHHSLANLPCYEGMLGKAVCH
jgi:hypothetical protein